MSSLGRTLTQVRKTGNNKQKMFLPKAFPVGIKTPLEKGYRDNETLFKMHFDIFDQIRDNLQNLVLTQKGERLGFPDFGTDLTTIYSNSNLTDSEIADILMFQIKEAVSKYMPSIVLQGFYSEKGGDELLTQFLSNNSLEDKGAELERRLNNVVIGQNTSLDKINKFTDKDVSIYKVNISYSIENDRRENELVFLIKSLR